MLSRRCIRVKIMQLLYALNRDEVLKNKDLKKTYKEWLEMSYELFLFNIYVITEICKLAQPDAEKRKKKHIPKEIDKAFSAKLFENETVQSIVTDKKLIKKFDKYGFENRVNPEYLGKIYDEFSKTEAYEKFILSESSKDDYVEILLELYRLCRGNEFFNEMLEDSYFNWIDDKSLVVGALKKYLKAQPQDNGFFETYYPDDETTKEFGEMLLSETCSQDSTLQEEITPVIKNWDQERVAVLDMILLKMAVTEMIQCKTIPEKVTINEYVEISKKYSTPKSKEFINGVLDKMYKDLEDAGKISKEGRGLTN